MLHCVANHTYLLIVNLQIRHANAVVPSFILLLSFDQIKDGTNGSGDDAWLLWTAQHGVCLTYGKKGHREFTRKGLKYIQKEVNLKGNNCNKNTQSAHNEHHIHLYH